MTLDDAIKLAEEVAEENQRIVDTGIVSDDISIDMLYCDDTEVIEEHLANYQRCADEHRQLAGWLKDYKRLKEQKPCEDCVSRQAVLERINDWWGITSTSGEPTLCDYIRELPPVTPVVKAIPLDKVKQARRELDKLPIYGAKFTDDFRIHLDREEVFSILDKLIVESEG